MQTSRCMFALGEKTPSAALGRWLQKEQEYQARRKEELDHSEAASRIQNEAVLLTIQDIGQRITDFLNKD